jgi:hypothetical protein
MNRDSRSRLLAKYEGETFMPRDHRIPAGRPALPRRSVLRGAAGVGAAGLAATALGGLGGQALAAPVHSAGQAAEEQRETASSEPIVAHVRDARTGDIDLYRGTGSAQLRDPDLAARLVRAAKQVR